MSEQSKSSVVKSRDVEEGDVRVKSPTRSSSKKTSVGGVAEREMSDSSSTADFQPVAVLSKGKASARRKQLHKPGVTSTPKRGVATTAVAGRI